MNRKSRILPSIFRVLLFALAAATALLSQSKSGQADTLEAQIRRIMDRPEFAHSTFGIEIYSMDSGSLLYQLNPDKLLVPGSTTKLVTEGTALELFGGDYRFHTYVYRTGPIDQKGVLEGDLVLVASGDLNLSGRIQSDGTLAF
ncbi:MAG TPA: D-alanyl-D-alanine carboxypeptidase, partial [Candidatus Bathyarchaeia archaeon]|nr:D-alanyl-D-alanine carboxypeptidase [Candidatus Bathyarchaeia archaeon]